MNLSSLQTWHLCKALGILDRSSLPAVLGLGKNAHLLSEQDSSDLMEKSDVRDSDKISEEVKSPKPQQQAEAQSKGHDASLQGATAASETTTARPEKAAHEEIASDKSVRTVKPFVDLLSRFSKVQMAIALCSAT